MNIPGIKTLDRYLIGKYLSTFFFAVLVCSMISMAIDFSDKVRSFMESGCTLKNILIDYFPGFVMHMAGLLMPMFTLISVVFFTSRLAFNSELLSILNAGVSFQRLLRPYLIAGGIICAMHLALSHYLIPRMNQSRLWFERTFVWTDKAQIKQSNIHFMMNPETKAYIKGYDPKAKRISTLRIEGLENHRVKHILEAENVVWKEDLQKWTLNTYNFRQFDGLKESYRRFNTPVDTAINLAPQDFVFYHNQNEEMTSWELLNAIERDRVRGFSNTRLYSIELARRFADAFTNIILTVIGLALAGRKVRGGMGLHLAFAVIIGFFFILVQKFAISFATSGNMPVTLGIWLPNIMFSIFAIWLVSRAQK
jgi:lipopolysaccharide export system permease protein